MLKIRLDPFCQESLWIDPLGEVTHNIIPVFKTCAKTNPRVVFSVSFSTSTAMSDCKVSIPSFSLWSDNWKFPVITTTWQNATGHTETSWPCGFRRIPQLVTQNAGYKASFEIDLRGKTVRIWGWDKCWRWFWVDERKMQSRGDNLKPANSGIWTRFGGTADPSTPARAKALTLGSCRSGPFQRHVLNLGGMLLSAPPVGGFSGCWVLESNKCRWLHELA